MISNMETVVVCPVCRHQNSAAKRFCAKCRARLASSSVTTNEEADDMDRRWRAPTKRRHLVRWGLVALIVLGVGAWIAYQNIGLTRFPPPPASNISASPMSGDWPKARRDPAHSGFVPNAGNVPKSEPKWRFVTDAAILSSPAVVEGRVYLSTGDRRVLALEAESGGLIWEHRVRSPVNSSPAVAGNLVFVGLREGKVLALRKDTGEQQWGYRTGAPVYSSPAVRQGVGYIGSGDGRLYALDAVTGEERWSYLTGGRLISDPAVHQDVVAITSQDGYLYIIDGATGKRRFDFRTSLTRGSPAFHEDRVYVADEGGVVRAIDWRKRELPFEKTPRWLRTQLSVWGFRRTGESFVGTPVVAGESVYIGSTSGTLFALNRSTREQVWNFRAKAGLTTSPSVVGQTVLVGDANGRLYAIDALSGELQWQFTTGAHISAAPAFANGVLYLTSQDETLYAIQ